jgi:glutaredoxin 3
MIIKKPIIYTLKTCPSCIKIKEDFKRRGVDFEERQVDSNQALLDEALKYGDMVPIVVYPDGHIEIGYHGMIGCYIA